MNGREKHRPRKLPACKIPALKMPPAFLPRAVLTAGCILEINVVSALEKAQPVRVIKPAALRLKVQLLPKIVFQSYQSFFIILHVQYSICSIKNQLAKRTNLYCVSSRFHTFLP